MPETKQKKRVHTCSLRLECVCCGERYWCYSDDALGILENGRKVSMD
jgi:hypothetical protein